MPDFFDEIASSYVRKDLEAYSRVCRRLRLERSIRNVPRPIPSILEVGCGAGFTADYLKGTYGRYVGVDSSQNLIAYARERNAGPNTDFLSESILEFHTAETFDLILMIGVLHHIPRTDEVLERLRPMLKPAGVLVANEPQAGNPFISWLRTLRKRTDTHYDVEQVELSEHRVRQLFVAAGYDVKTFPQGIMSTPLAETLVLPPALGLPLAYASRVLDPVIESIISLPVLRRLSWNVVAEARPVA